MVAAIQSIGPSERVHAVKSMDEAQLRPKSSPVSDRYVDTLESMKDSAVTTTKPALEATLSSTNVSPGVIFARLMDTIQKYVNSTSATAELKHEQVGRKIQKTEEKLRQVQKDTLEAHKSTETWNTRHMIANCVLNGVTTLTGIGLTVAGNPWTGGSLIVSGVGSTASELMNYYGWNSSLTAATSIISGVIGIFGGLGSGLAQLARNPTLFMNSLTSGSLSTALQVAGSVTSLLATGLSGYAMVERSKTEVLLAELEAVHTQVDTSLRTLQQKYSGATTAFQGSVKNFSGLFKTIAKTHNRYTKDCMRMLTAEFPA